MLCRQKRYIEKKERRAAVVSTVCSTRYLLSAGLCSDNCCLPRVSPICRGAVSTCVLVLGSMCCFFLDTYRRGTYNRTCDSLILGVPLVKRLLFTWRALSMPSTLLYSSVSLHLHLVSCVFGIILMDKRTSWMKKM